jgi:hypothetical protein
MAAEMSRRMEYPAGELENEKKGMIVILTRKNKKLRRRDLIALAKSVIAELGLPNIEVMLHLYGGLKVCLDCKAQHLFIDRFCPECGILSPATVQEEA